MHARRTFAATSLLALIACVGDDPPAVSTDAGAPDSATPADSGADAGTTDGGATDAAPPVDAGPPDAGPDAGPPPAPPVGSPYVWLDARRFPAGVTSTTRWPDATANNADAVGTTALTIDRTVLNGRPGVVFVGEAAQVLSIAAKGIPALRTAGTSQGFSVFMVAGIKDGAPARTAQAVLFERAGNDGAFLNPKRYGVQLSLNAALTSVEGWTKSYTTNGPQVEAVVTGTAPRPTAAHLYVLTAVNGELALRIDGVEAMKKTGFVENNFSDNGNMPLNLGAYSSTTSAQFGFVGAMGMFALYTRPLSNADIVAGEAAAKTAWGIP